MAAEKTRLVMKRLSDVKPGDIWVGRTGWQNIESAREVLRVKPSPSRPGKLRLAYALEDDEIGWVDRAPDFYLICLKESP